MTTYKVYKQSPPMTSQFTRVSPFEVELDNIMDDELSAKRLEHKNIIKVYEAKLAADLEVVGSENHEQILEIQKILINALKDKQKAEIGAIKSKNSLRRAMYKKLCKTK